MLAGDRKLGLSLLFECLTKANFPKDVFERDKNKLLSEIDDADSLADARAHRAFMAAVYGKHPAGRPAMGTRKSVEKLTADDCAAFYKKVFVPNNTIVAIVGDFDSKQVIDEVKALTAGWKKSAWKSRRCRRWTSLKGSTQNMSSRCRRGGSVALLPGSCRRHAQQPRN